MNNKYKMIKADKTVNGKPLYQIEALKDFGDVKKGEKGGYIEKEDNLSVYGDAKVDGNTCVDGDAWVYGTANISGDARVSGEIKLSTGWCLGRKRKENED